MGRLEDLEIDQSRNRHCYKHSKVTFAGQSVNEQREPWKLSGRSFMKSLKRAKCLLELVKLFWFSSRSAVMITSEPGFFGGGEGIWML